MNDKQIQEAAEKHARKTVKDLPIPSLRSEMTHLEWIGWFKEEFEAGANFVQSQSQWIPVYKRLPSYGELIVLQYPPEHKRLPYVVVFDRDTPLFDGSEWFPVPPKAETR